MPKWNAFILIIFLNLYYFFDFLLKNIKRYFKKRLLNVRCNQTVWFQNIFFNVPQKKVRHKDLEQYEDDIYPFKTFKCITKIVQM